MKNLSHIAIIPDGNRRWAKKRGLAPWEGHEAGTKHLEDLLETASKEGIKYFSFWGSSEDNLEKRPFLEKKALLRIYKENFEKMCTSPKIHQNQIRINVIGEWKKQFPETLKKTIRKVIDSTKHYNKFLLNIFLAYSGNTEMKETIKNIASDLKAGKIKTVTDDLVKKYLWTSELPPVDLLIRSGSTSDPHLSAGFMMWDTQNSQLYFSKKDWPDFNAQELKNAIQEYRNRIRRYGE